jgi:hypothetical protein
LLADSVKRTAGAGKPRTIPVPHRGCITHWSPLDPALDRMGVNARLMEPAIVAAARVRRFDGANTWTFLE